MKAHLTKVSLALLSAAFLLGCQEQGPDLVGPEGPGPELDHKGKPHGKPGGGGEESTVTLTVGMQAGPFPVGEPQKTGKKTLGFSNHNQPKPAFIQMAFGDLGACLGFKATNGGTIPVGAEFDKLVEQLTEPAPAPKFVMKIDKTKLGFEASGHTLTIQYDDEDLGNTRIQLGGPHSEPGLATVTEVGGPGTDVFAITGSVVVWDVAEAGQPAHEERLIYCPGMGSDPNQVVVTLER